MDEGLPFLSRKIRELRTAAGMTQQQLAVAADLSVSVISQIEQGTNADPRMSTLKAIAAALGVDMAELVRAASKPPAKKKRR